MNGNYIFASEEKQTYMSTIQEILALNTAEQMRDALAILKPRFKKSLDETEAEYDVYRHAVFDINKRKRKKIKIKTGKTDPSTGEVLYKTKFQDVCRIGVPLQRLLVERSAGFLLGRPVEYALNSDNKSKETQTLFDEVLKVFKHNKLKYFDKDLARRVFRGCEAAELWYFVPDENGHPTEEIKVKLLSPLLGDRLLPHFDDYGRMDGFCRCYKTRDIKGRFIDHVDIYTNTLVYKFTSEVDGAVLSAASSLPHGFKRLPIVYYRQEQTEWNDVQSEIERIETLLSNWGDTNDYFGSPSYFFKGTLKGFAEKGEQGKVYQGEGDTDMKVLSWDNSPSSIANELAQLINIVFSYTQTADVSFANMKQLGSNTSGVAMKLMFTDPFMKADDKQEIFGDAFERRFNIVKDGVCQRDGISESVMEATFCEPIFSPYLPKNEQEEIQMLNLSTNGKPTMSQKTAVALNPKVANPDEEMKNLEEEEQAQQAQQVEEMGKGDSALLNE